MTITSITQGSQADPEPIEWLWRGIYGYSLSATQVHAVNSVLFLLDDKEEGVLTGPAGTGKSCVTAAIILAACYEGHNVEIAAPTHKAANVLGGLLAPFITLEEREVLRAAVPTPRTLHSLLNLKPGANQEGQPQRFVQTRPPDLSEVDLLIVDECSMVGAELYRYTTEAAKRSKTALLWVGDPSQLNPVNEKRQSLSFDQQFVIRLTEVMRHDGAILKLATRARKMAAPQIVAEQSADSEVITYDTQEDVELAWLNELERRMWRGQDITDSVVMLCYMNANRRRLNRAAREVLCGEGAPAYMPNDELLTLDTIKKDGVVLLPNNYKFKLDNAEYVEDYQPIDADLFYRAWRLTEETGLVLYVLDDADHERWIADYKLLGRHINKDITNTKKAVTAVEEQCQSWCETYGSSSARLESALRQARDLQRRTKDRWGRDYYPLKQAFVNVDFPYALTIHKSQGSTYPEVFVCDDYERSRDERQALLYVAVTRASKRLHHRHTGIMPRAGRGASGFPASVG
jgi:exodeoxyribonuclease V